MRLHGLPAGIGIVQDYRRFGVGVNPLLGLSVAICKAEAGCAVVVRAWKVIPGVFVHEHPEPAVIDAVGMLVHENPRLRRSRRDEVTSLEEPSKIRRIILRVADLSN